MYVSTGCSACAQEEQKGTVDGELATVIASITLACKQISSLVNRAGISNLTGLDGGENFSVSNLHSLAAQGAWKLHVYPAVNPSVSPRGWFT